MGDLREFVIDAAKLWSSPVHRFIAEHGQEFQISERTFKGRRAKRGMCFMNCVHRVLESDRLTYCEGYVSVHGVPIEHAWLIDESGCVVDPTLTPTSPLSRVSEYFGVAFETRYVLESAVQNRVYGLLGWQSETARALVEGRVNNFKREVTSGKQTKETA